MSSEEVIQVEIKGHVAIMTLNRPQKMNALDKDMAEAMHVKLDELDAAWPQVRAIVLTGAGRGFCSGADVGRMPTDPSVRPPKDPYGREIIDIGPHMRRVPQPIIAAVNGAAVGAGLALACCCDVRIAAEGARFSSAFIKRSLVPDTGVAYLLPRIVGQGIAHEMALTGGLYDAQFALRTGLVNRVVAPEQLLPECMAMAEEIAGNPPIAVRSTKKLMDGLWRDLGEVIYTEREYNRQSLGTRDRAESAASFLEKRKPVYTGQ